MGCRASGCVGHEYARESRAEGGVEEGDPKRRKDQEGGEASGGRGRAQKVRER